MDAMDSMRGADALAQRYKRATKDLSILRVVQPADTATHRKTFLDGWRNGTATSPSFTYKEIPDGSLAELRMFCAEMRASGDPEDLWHGLIIEQAHRFLDRYEACASHDAVRITGVTTDENGAPSQEAVEDALEILHAQRHLPATGIGDQYVQLIAADKVATVLAAVLERQGLDDWEVRIKHDMAAQLSVDASTHGVNVNPGVLLSEDEIVRLIVHEIGTHVFRSVNASLGPTVLTLALSGHTATEEGLAIWNEGLGVPGRAPARRTAVRVLAVDAALRGSFVDVVHALEPFVSLDDAFSTAVRVKRGLIDTSVPGCFAKDHVYLSGFRAVEKHLSEHPEEHALLMAAKWPLGYLHLLRGTGLVEFLGDRLRQPNREFTAETRDAVRQVLA